MNSTLPSPPDTPGSNKRTPAQQGWLQKHGQKLIAASFWLLLLASYALYMQQNNLGPLQALRQVLEFLATNPLGPLIFIGLYIARPLIFFSAGVLSIAAGVLFGPVWGVIYTVIGSNLGASLAYVIGRFFSQSVLDETETKQGGINNYIARMRSNSFETVFIMRLIFLPYDLVNYLAGFLKIHYGAFIFATILGSLPGTISFALFGASTGGLEFAEQGFDWRAFGLSVLIFVVSLLVSRLVKRKESSRSEA